MENEIIQTATFLFPNYNIKEKRLNHPKIEYFPPFLLNPIQEYIILYNEIMGEITSYYDICLN